MASNTNYECEEDGTEELNIEITEIFESGPHTPGRFVLKKMKTIKLTNIREKYFRRRKRR